MLEWGKNRLFDVI